MFYRQTLQLSLSQRQKEKKFYNVDYRSQRLSDPGSEWELGEDLYLSKPTTGQCLVQLNATVTVFLGGSNDNHGIVLFNWETLKYRYTITILLIFASNKHFLHTL